MKPFLQVPARWHPQFAIFLATVFLSVPAQAWLQHNLPDTNGSGWGNAIVIDTAGRYHISTIDTLTHKLRYYRSDLRENYTFTDVDDVGTALWRTAIATDSAGGIHISYFSNAGLKYAYFDGTAWTTELIDASGYSGPTVFNSFMWQVVRDAGTGIRVDASGRPHISYYAADSDSLRHAVRTNTSWTTETIASGGFFNSLALDSASQPMIAFTDPTGIKVARWSGAAWTVGTVEIGAGYGPSLVLGPDGQPWVSYRLGAAIKFARWTGSSWAVETAYPRNGMYGTSMVVDLEGNPHIAYGNNQDGNVPCLNAMVSRSSGSLWTNELVALLWMRPDNTQALTIDNEGLLIMAFDETYSPAQHLLKVIANLPPRPDAHFNRNYFGSGDVLYASWRVEAHDVASYHLQIGTDPATNDTSIVDTDVGPTVTYYLMSGMVPGKTYYARVRFQDFSGKNSFYSYWSDGATWDITAPSTPTVHCQTHPTHETGYPSNMPICALSGGADPSGIKDYFWRLDANPDSSATTSDQLSLADAVRTTALLADGTYYFHAAARDNAGNLGGSTHYKLIVAASVDPNALSVFVTTEGVIIRIPPGTLSSPTQINIAPVFTIPGSDGPANASMARELTMADGTHWFNKALTITIPYDPAAIGTMDPATLRLAYYETNAARWIRIPTSTVDVPGRTVSAAVNHFTMFGVVGAATLAGSPVENVHNFPNPFSPLRGQSTRLRYSIDQDRDVRVRIFDAFGRLARDERVQAGMPGAVGGVNEFIWDGRSADGRHVGMGSYIGVIEAGGKRATTRIGVK